MNTNYFLNPSTNNSKTSAFNCLNRQNFKQQKPNPVLQDDGFVDEFFEGDFTKNLKISALNNWSIQHPNSFPSRVMKPCCPHAN